MPLRLLLVALAALAAGGCAPALTAASSTPAGQAAIERAVQSALVRAGLAEPTSPLVAAEAEAPTLAAGPMLADVTQRGAAVWVLTAPGAEVVVDAFGPDSLSAGGTMLAASGRTTSGSDGTATVRLFGLEPGTTYDYTVTVDGVDVTPTAYPARIDTQPLWQWRTDPPAFTAAVGSCYYDNDPAYDRPGGAYGGPTSIFGEIAALDPDLMLWLGDNVYLREVDWWDAAGMDYRYRHSRSEPALQPLLARAAHYAIWDDHDYGPNDSNRSYVLKDEALETFTDYWPAAARGLPGVPGVFTQFQWADVDFFMLDDRWHRAPNDAPPDERQILGPEQVQWLLDALTTSQAPFKVVAVGGQFLNPLPVFETFAAIAPAERQLLLDEIAARQIEGVVFLSGDRHHTELLRLARPGAYPLYEFTSSPLTAGASTYPLREDSPERANPLRVDGTLVAGERNFGTLTVTGPRTDRVMTMRTYKTDGALLWEHAVRARDLQYPGAD
jgi:alkaline phosphatase D